MSISRFRREIRDIIEKKPGIGMHKRDDSLAYLSSGDETYCNRHVLVDLVESVGIYASVHEYVEEQTKDMSEKELQEYWRSLSHNPDIEVDSGSRIKSNEAILLARNLKVAGQAYLRLGSEEKLGHTEQEQLLKAVRHLPALMEDASALFAKQRDEMREAGDQQAQSYFTGMLHFAKAMAKIAESQLKGLEGRGGRGGKN